MQDVYVNLVRFLRRYTPVPGGNWTAAGPVNRVAVAGSPFANRMQSSYELWVNLAIRHRADIQQ